MVDQTPELHIYTLGSPEVRKYKNLVTFPTRKSLALLIYLAVEPGAQTREHLATLLWPEASSERSYANLRNTLAHLQAALSRASEPSQVTYLSITHNSLALNPDANIEFDVRIVERAYAQARADRSSRPLPDGSVSLPLLQSAAACLRGDFLAGFSLGDAPGFDDWVAIQREIWRRRLGLVLDRLSEIQFSRGDFSGATETASQWIALDALNEEAYRRKMQAHFAAGERGQALETYEACYALLKAELNIEPEPDTAALAERIRTQAHPAHPQTFRPVPQPYRLDTSVAFLGQLFAGRTSEYQALVQSYERAAAGQPQLVVLRGEAGIGKTRLARKFLDWTAAQEAELLQGSAFESGSHLPLQPLVEALRLRLDRDPSLKELLNSAGLSPLSQLLPELRQLDPSLSPGLKPPQLEAEISQTQLFEPIVQITLALSQKAPLVLFVDDLQWADSATLDLLQYAARRWKESAAQASSLRVMLLVSLRSEALRPVIQSQAVVSPAVVSQWLSRIERELTPVLIELTPLGERETVQLVQSILNPPAEDFAQWLYAETHGQPFYLIETLKDLLERRVLHPKHRATGRWTFAVDSEHNLGQAVRVPSTVHGVIQSRLNRLSPNAFSMLASGAVLEQQITFELLSAIANVTEDLALPALDELINGRFLLEAPQPGAASAYAFTNDMLRDVVYTEAGDARRRLFHQRARAILESAGESEAVLAHHAEAAGLELASFHHSLAAGREALRLSAVSEAIVHLERAHGFVQEALASELPGKADLLNLYTQLGRAYELDGQAEKALAMNAERDRIRKD